MLLGGAQEHTYCILYSALTTADLLVCKLPVGEPTGTLTFSVLPSSFTSTLIYYSLLRTSENNPTKGYYVTKGTTVYVTNALTIWLSILARIQNRHSWSFPKKN